MDRRRVGLGGRPGSSALYGSRSSSSAGAVATAGSRPRPDGHDGAALRRRGGIGRRRPRLRRRVSTTSSAAASPPSTATTTGAPDLYLAGGDGAGRPVPQRERARRDASLRAGRRRCDGPDAVDRRLPARHRRRRPGRPRRPAARRERPPARPGRLPLRAGQRGARAVDGGDELDRRRSAPPGRTRRPCRRSPSATTWAGRGRRTDHRAAPTARCVRPAADGDGVRGRRSRCRPGWCTLSMLFSDWDRSGRRDLRVSNDRHYYRDGEEQLWRIEPGQPPRAYTRRRRLGDGSALGHGHRQPGRDRRRLSRGLPDQPGRQQAADAGRRAAASRRTRTSPWRWA